MNKIEVIIGPTASGKSKLSIERALETGASIISADAFQVYKEFNIGTGKLSSSEMAGIQHHLIDICDPNEPYTVQQFIKDVKHICSYPQKGPFIICGGSAMYLKALLYGYKPLKRLPENERPEGLPEDLWCQLNDIDPDLASKTPYQNKQRIQRYLELYMIYNKKPSELFVATPFESKKYKVTGILIENSVLKEKINVRVDQMITTGLVEEVDYLMKKYDTSSQGFQGIGYKEPVQYLKGRINKEEMIHLIKKNTYQYAKRQMTWFKAFDHVQWISKK